jgi:hypothetical protein
MVSAPWKNHRQGTHFGGLDHKNVIYVTLIIARFRFGFNAFVGEISNATESLDEVKAVQAQRDVLLASCRAASEESRALAQEASRLDGQIRDILPAGVWYRVNGKGIKVEPGVATQIMDWEDVLERVNAPTAG